MDDIQSIAVISIQPPYQNLLKCLECGEQAGDLTALAKHLMNEHFIDHRAYAIKHFMNGQRPRCQHEGCQEHVKFITMMKYKRFCEKHKNQSRVFHNKQRKKGEREKTFIELMKVMQAEGYEVIGDYDYQSVHHNIEMKHIECGTVFNPRIEALIKGTRCPSHDCMQAKRTKDSKTKTRFFEELEKNNFEIEDPNWKYVSARQKVTFRHKPCGMTKTQEIKAWLRAKGACKCTNRKHILVKERLRSVLSELSSEYQVVTEINTNKTNDRIQLIHIKCGTEFSPTLHNFLDNESRCPNCCYSESEEEKEVYEFVKSCGVDAERRKTGILGRKELDIFVPSKNFAIEYNGIFWHSSRNNTPRSAHQFKTDACLALGIQLIHVWSSEWKAKQNIVKSIIKHRLGISENKVQARKCEIIDLPKSHVEEFFDQTHISGSCRFSKHFVLVHDNRIVAALAFKKPTQKKKYSDSIEITRFSTALNTSVVGGFSKLLNAAKKWALQEGYKSIISYVDMRYGTGNSYRKIGFEEVGKTQISYWYTDGNDLFYRFTYRAKDGKSEREVAADAKVHRVYGCKNLIFRLALENP